MPRFHLVRGPLRRLVGVAAVAGVGRAERDAEVGARDPHAVIAARIDDHIGAGRHVTRDALRASRIRRVPMVGGNIVFFRRMALGADPIAGARNFKLWKSWQSLQVTPAWNMRLCRNDPY